MSIKSDAFQILKFIVEKRSTNSNKIEEHFKFDKDRILDALRYLEQKWLIEIGAKTLNGNWIMIKPTANGIDLYEDIQNPPIESTVLVQEGTVSLNKKGEKENVYDVFISHASEDKEDFVRALANELTKLGIKVWYDEFSLKIGDSLRRSIDRGLTNSRYGIIILSKNFFAKEWPQKELDGLIAKEVNGRKVILPIWHNITKEDVLKYSPILADKVAADTSKGSISQIAMKLKEVIKG